MDPAQGSSTAARVLWAIRWKLGELLGWDGPDAGLGTRVPSLRERLPADLRDAPPGPDFAALPFRWLYVIEDEHRFLVTDTFESGPELVETVSGWQGTRISRALSERVAAARPPVCVHQEVRLRVLRAI